MDLGDALRRQLASQRAHVLAAVADLDDDAMARVVAPLGWSISQLLQHLTVDDEMFWISGVLGGDARAAEAVAAGTDGWKAAPLAGTEATQRYRAECALSDGVLDRIDLDAPPAWWPEAIFGGWRLASGGEVLLHLIAETATHAGHLDVVREEIDGTQHLVV